MCYEFDAAVSARVLAALRQSVGWNRMERELTDTRLHNAFQLYCFDGDRLVGYSAVVSNGVTDAYIQDLMVHPDYQQQGIGRQLMQRTLERLRNEGIYMVSVIYGDAELQKYYEEFGFTTMLCGQMELRPERD
ncbi:MAG: GNAT family N-acetyltransferase [Clostridia bacterium]|nr:GNAT family N-acetyltransferase [Clostridia bacterium]